MRPPTAKGDIVAFMWHPGYAALNSIQGRIFCSTSEQLNDSIYESVLSKSSSMFDFLVMIKIPLDFLSLMNFSLSFKYQFSS